MADKSDIFGVSEMHELAISGRKAGWVPGEFGDLATNHKLLTDFHDVRHGFAEIKPRKWQVVGDAAPAVFEETDSWGPGFTHIYEGFENQSMGLYDLTRHGQDLFINGKKIVLVYHHEKSQAILTPKELGRWLKLAQSKDTVLNWTVAAVLHKEQHLIPESWDARAIFFPATKYRPERQSDRARKDTWAHPQKDKEILVPYLAGGNNWIGGFQKGLARVKGDKMNQAKYLSPVLPVLEN